MNLKLLWIINALNHVKCNYIIKNKHDKNKRKSVRFYVICKIRTIMKTWFPKVLSSFTEKKTDYARMYL